VSGATDLSDDEAKYESTNPLLRWRLGAFLAALGAAIGEPGPAWLDVGTGEGYALRSLRQSDAAMVGVEIELDRLRAAVGRVPGLHAMRADIGHLPVRDGAASLVTCLEVLEHLDDPRPAVAEIARVCGGRAIVTVPFEPVFRLGNLARGKHVGRLGNHPEHVGQFTPGRLRSLLAPSFRDVSITVVAPWLVAVATP
jgi:ubiquinone/menaquinone biosynthesis C-methylase UbiE